MMNLATTQFWINHIYRPAGCRQHAMLEQPDALLSFLAGRDPEALIPAMLGEARSNGRNLSPALLRMALAEALTRVSVPQSLSSAQQTFRDADHARHAPTKGLEGYADGQTTRDWMDISGWTQRLRRRSSTPLSQLVAEILAAAAPLNLDPLFVRLHVQDQAGQSDWRAAA